MAGYIDGELLIEKMTRLRGCSCSYSDGIIDEVEDIMSDLPTADVIPIPEGATNGDMIKMLFPDVEVDEKSEDTVHLKDKWHNPLVFIQIPKDIWNTPYKKEGSVNKLKYTFADDYELVSDSVGSEELIALTDAHGFVEVSEVEE